MWNKIKAFFGIKPKKQQSLSQKLTDVRAARVTASGQMETRTVAVLDPTDVDPLNPLSPISPLNSINSDELYNIADQSIRQESDGMVPKSNEVPQYDDSNRSSEGTSDDAGISNSNNTSSTHPVNDAPSSFTPSSDPAPSFTGPSDSGPSYGHSNSGCSSSSSSYDSSSSSSYDSGSSCDSGSSSW